MDLSLRRFEKSWKRCCISDLEDRLEKRMDSAPASSTDWQPPWPVCGDICVEVRARDWV